MADRKNSEAATSRYTNYIPPPSFPTHNSPRVWFITQGLSPISIRLMRLLLGHGDYVVACLPPHDLDNEVISAEFRELADECRNPSAAAGRGKDREGWKDRIRGIRCDGRFMGQCGAAVAEAVHVFGRIDIVLCCSSVAVVGSVEELGGGAGGKTPNLLSQNLVRDQFETVFFSQVNYIKAALPQLRGQRTGHILVLSSIGGHIGMPGMPIHTAATWALEGYCDSLAYEIAPFNIKVTVVQPNTEVQTLSNKIIFAPSMPEYEAAAEASAIAAAQASAAAAAAETQGPGGENLSAADLIEAPTPSLREMLNRVLDLHGENVAFTTTTTTTTATTTATTPSAASPSVVSPSVVSPAASASTSAAAASAPTSAAPTVRYPKLPTQALDRLVQETVQALAAIGGHENPPTRHIVGFEATTSVQDKLKTVSEELEDFVEASLSVDIFDSELKKEAREGRAAQLAAEAAAESAAQLAAELE